VRVERAQPPIIPGTYIGQWFRALLLSDEDARKQLHPHLNGGKPGWNDDEPAVLQAVCELALRRFFGTNHDPAEVTEFIVEVRYKMLARGLNPIAQKSLEAVIRAGLGEDAPEISRLTGVERVSIRNIVTVHICDLLNLRESQISEMIVAAEDLAGARGWTPPLYPGKLSQGGTTSPETYIGHWLRALLLKDTDPGIHLTSHFDTEDGLSDGDSAVLEAVCQLTIKRFFRNGYDTRRIKEFSVQLHRQVVHLPSVPSQESIAAVVRSALAGVPSGLSGLSEHEVVNVRVFVVVAVRDTLSLSEQQVCELIAAAERLARARGCTPQLYAAG
jgi:hypothetical protein